MVRFTSNKDQNVSHRPVTFWHWKVKGQRRGWKKLLKSFFGGNYVACAPIHFKYRSECSNSAAGMSVVRRSASFLAVVFLCTVYRPTSDVHCDNRDGWQTGCCCRWYCYEREPYAATAVKSGNQTGIMCGYDETWMRQLVAITLCTASINSRRCPLSNGYAVAKPAPMSPSCLYETRDVFRAANCSQLLCCSMITTRLVDRQALCQHSTTRNPTTLAPGRTVENMRDAAHWRRISSSFHSQHRSARVTERLWQDGRLLKVAGP